MRYLLLILISLTVHVKETHAHITTKDSLLQVLSATTDPTKQVKIYRNLADLMYEMPEELGYLQALYKKAEMAGQIDVALEALSDLTLAYIDNQQVDSVDISMSAISYLTSNSNDEDQWKCYLNMYAFRSEVMRGNGAVLIKHKLESSDERKKRQQSLYKQVEDAFVLGVGYYEQNRIKDAVHYFEAALETSKKLPLKEGRRYRLQSSRMLAAAYSSSNQHGKAIAIMDEVIKIQNNYYELYCKERPFYPIDILHIYNYSSLLMNAEFMSEDRVQFNLNQLIKLSESAISTRSKYSCFFGINNYYISRKNYEKALMCSDSMIKYALIDAPNNVPTLYNIRSKIYEDMGKPNEALVSLKKSYEMQDSLITEDMREKLNNLQVEYDVNRLEYEKSQLEIHTKHIMVIWLSVVLVLVVVLCSYLYVSLKKERKQEVHLHLLKQRAEESEKIKTAFVNSICHEIRTPLNAIVGFTDLIFDEALDKEMRMTFPGEIKRSSTILTSLVDSMLEVANLDVSDETLPCEQTDIAAICCQEFYRLAEQNPNVEYRIKLSENPMFISTNARYLTLVINNILSNAGKFTENGCIVLECHKESKRLVLSVTDTGCGIPKEMQYAIFDRFVKLDSYKQGSGLGLYLCRLIVKRLSGKMYIDPEYTVGTRMIVELPIN